MIDPEQEMAEVRELSAGQQIRESVERSKKHDREAQEANLRFVKKQHAERRAKRGWDTE
ncbi:MULTISPECIES: hypothetical protein [unclassified Ruegeria]|uniref:hypothetical protein n=1 Tax=unclassified Ruegeria TaxID=2625375 RepID=UPI001492CE52|nr:MULTISPECIES: hypothetical protein [unclassified Ruegeria]NOD87408.1 hypothetical protein [Ruegeria sp. HKCCD4318]NOE12963.1 hypothetical protein [Ruegeria sp. HKCCD4318-2]NOG08870.1 hypothetical protein [Ruegeria sp. HKCCD4315]